MTCMDCITMHLESTTIPWDIIISDYTTGEVLAQEPLSGKVELALLNAQVVEYDAYVEDKLLVVGIVR